jgi:hypothetical protein
VEPSLSLIYSMLQPLAFSLSIYFAAKSRELTWNMFALFSGCESQKINI